MVDSNFSRRRFLKLGASGAIVVVVAGVGAYLALQPQPSSTPVATPRPSPTPTPAAPPPPPAATPSPSPTPVIPRPSPTPVATPTPTPTMIELAKKEGKVMLYSPWWFSTLEALKKGFEAKYPGVTVEIVRGLGEVVQRALSEYRAGKHIMDVYVGSQAMMIPLVEEGVPAEYTSSVDNEYPPELKYTQPKWKGTVSPAISAGVIGIAYHKDLPKESVPKDWWDVVNPRFKGRAGVWDPIAAPYIWVTLERKIIGTDKYDSWLQRIKETNPKVGPYYGFIALAGKEFDVIYPGYYSTFLDNIAKGAPLEIVKTPKVLIGEPQHAIVNKFAPHPNAARLFRDFALSQEGVMAVAQVGVYLMLKPGVPSFLPGIEAKDLVLTPFLTKEEIEEASKKLEKVFIK